MNCKLFPPLSIYEQGQRDNQEDALYPLHGESTANDRLFVLCDGMGGHERGEVASQTVSQAIGKYFREHISLDEPFTDDQLRDALEYAYTQLDQCDDGSPKKMGTTLTLLYIHARGITAAHIGDSRIYHIRPNVGVLYQSRDHSLVFDLFQSGEITYDEMQTSQQKNIITRAMQPGVDNRVRPDIIHITDIQPDDYFFLCSDGILENIDSSDLLFAIFSKETDDESKHFVLFHGVKDNQDNHSAWIIHIKDVIHETGDETLVNEEPTVRCNAINIIRERLNEGKKDSSDDVVVVSPPKQNASSSHKLLPKVLLGVLTL